MFSDFKNQIDFYIRNKSKFSRKNFVEKDKNLLEINLAQNNYFEAVLEKYFIKNYKKNLKILDIGSKNWFYVKGLHKYFSSFSFDFVLDGIELDAYRLYSNFYSRFEVAKYYMQDLKNAYYIACNLLDIKEKYDYITWFLPFVTIKPHKFWGLPERYFYPEKLLLHAVSLLDGSGQMLIINQGEIEAEIQKNMLEKLKIPYNFLGEIKNEFYQFQNKRFGFLIQK